MLQHISVDGEVAVGHCLGRSHILVGSVGILSQAWWLCGPEVWQLSTDPWQLCRPRPKVWRLCTKERGEISRGKTFQALETKLKQPEDSGSRAKPFSRLAKADLTSYTEARCVHQNVRGQKD